MPSWPASLPELNIAGRFSLSEADNLLRSPMSVGPAKVRRRGTSAPRPVRMGHPALTEAQVATFATFYRDTLQHGALSFDMADPSPGASGTATFRFRAAPTVTPSAPDVWALDCDLEILP